MKRSLSAMARVGFIYRKAGRGGLRVKVNWAELHRSEVTLAMATGNALEQAGLIALRLIHGQCTEVTILDCPIEKGGDANPKPEHYSPNELL